MAVASDSQPSSSPSPTSTERILSASNLSKSHDAANVLYNNLNIAVHRGEKIAIVGPNGAGKSTLLYCLAGILTPDTGSVSLRKGVVSALVAQDLPSYLDQTLTVSSAVLQLASDQSSTPPVRAALRHANALSAVARIELDSSTTSEDEQTKALRSLAAAAAAMDECPGAWEVDSRVSSALSQLGVPPEAVLQKLSGGQKRRVGIAAALAANPDILFLDEVTNHLSIDGIQFLENFLSDPSLTVVAISHDRAFINAVCTSAIWELETGELHRHSAPYDAFLVEKDARLAADKRRAYVMQKALVKQLEWLRRQPKARSTKNRSRINDTMRLQDDVETTKKRRNRRALEVQQLTVSSARLGGDVVSMKNVTIRRGKKLIVEGMNYTFERGERVGIVGKNGVGKSSLLKTIAGLAEADKGAVHVGETVVFGYFDQEGIDLTARLSEGSAAARGVDSVDQLRLVDYVSELRSRYGDMPTSETATKARSSTSDDQSLKDDEAYAKVTEELERLSYSGAMLARSPGAGGNTSGSTLSRMSSIGLLDHFGFARDRQHGLIKHLSGGEKRRLQLLGLLLKCPNFLILDEVSNDLDLNTLTMIEQVLEEYDGVLVLCSHDRFMLDRLVDHLIVVDGDSKSVQLVEGKFSDYLEDVKEAKQKEAEHSKAKTNSQKSTATQGKRKLSFKERKEYERLEVEIEQDQKEYDALCERLSNESQEAGFEKTKLWGERLAQLEQSVNDKTDRWMQLAEIDEG